jgi:membrane associated rhomboid family serine protease
MKAQNDSIGHTAHFGGAVGGILVTLFFDFEVVFNSQLMLGVLTLTVLIAGFFLYRNK